MSPDPLERLIGEHFEPTREDLWALVQWLAQPYQADPDFVVADEPDLPFIDKQHRYRLKQTWETVVGTKGTSPELFHVERWVRLHDTCDQPGCLHGEIQHVTIGRGDWRQCQTCGTLLYVREEIPA